MCQVEICRSTQKYYFKGNDIWVCLEKTLNSNTWSRGTRSARFPYLRPLCKCCRAFFAAKATSKPLKDEVAFG